MLAPRHFITIIMVLLFYSCKKIDSSNIEYESYWPDAKRAAVCLSYDDGMESHLDEVIHKLNHFGLKATFYPNANAKTILDRREEWIEIAKAGHELGNHTLFHPCMKTREGRDTFDWVLPEYDLNHYSLEKIREEIKLANSVLTGIDGKEKRSFAYTCVDHLASGESFANEISDLVTAARAAGPIPDDPKSVDLFMMPSVDVAGYSGAELIGLVEQAIEKNSIITFMFHGVGKEHLKVSIEAHDELLEYLSVHKEDLWIDSFLSITDYIRKQRAS